MHGRRLYAVLIISTLLVGFRFYTRDDGRLGGVHETPRTQFASNKNFYDSVERQIEQLPKQLRHISSKQKRLEYVKTVYTQIENLRKSTSPNSMRREVETDLMMEPLKNVVNTPRYNKSHCAAWEHRLQADFEPSESGEITNPHLKKAQRVIASICD